MSFKKILIETLSGFKNINNKLIKPSKNPDYKTKKYIDQISKSEIIPEDFIPAKIQFDTATYSEHGRSDWVLIKQIENSIVYAITNEKEKVKFDIKYIKDIRF